MKIPRAIQVFVLFAVMGILGACGFIQSVSLALDLLVAIKNAPVGQKACAAFEVLNTQADGASMSGLINIALKQSGSSVQFTPADGDTVLLTVRAINCEFISCVVTQIKDLNPPLDDSAIPAWVQERLELLGGVLTNCPSPLTLTEDQMVQLVRMIVSLKL